MLRVVTQAAGTIPIVVMSGDLVPGGFAKTLARPGGNVTGMSLTDARPKQFEILKDAVPSIQRIGAVMPMGRAGAAIPRLRTLCLVRAGDRPSGSDRLDLGARRDR